MWFPIDFPAPSEHFVKRTLTSQVTTAQTQGMQIPLSWRGMDVNATSETTQGNTLTKNSTLARVTKRNLGISASPSSGLWFSALFNEEIVSARNIPDTGVWRVSGLQEEFQIREVVARAGFDLLNNVQMGLGMRSQSIRGDFLGSFFAEADERVISSGSRLGIVAGLLVNLSQVQFAVRYDAPVNGKVDIRGESKVSSAPGYTGIAAQLAASSETSIQGEYGYYSAIKNELASPVASPDATRNLNISPLGMAVDARLVPLDVMGVGLSQKLGASVRLQFDAMRGTAYLSADPELLVPGKIDDSQKQKVDSFRLGLSIEKSDWESQVFGDYGTSKISYTSSNVKTSRTLSYWGVGLRAGVDL